MAPRRLSLAERKARAADPATPPDELDRLAKDYRDDVRALVASNPNATLATVAFLVTSFPAEVAANPSLALWELTGGDTPDEHELLVSMQATFLPSLTDPEAVARYEHSSSWHVRKGVAVSKVASPDLLARLARDPSPFVRQSVASNPRTPTEALVSLLDDRDDATVMRVAANPNLPAVWVAPLVDDARFNVRMSALDNPNVPVAAMRRMIDDEDAQMWIAGNVSAPADLLERLSTSRDGVVRQNVAENPATPLHVLTRMIEDDPNDRTRQAALENRRRRGETD